MASASNVTTLADFSNLKLIGKGSFGRVYRANRNSDGNEYALKEVEIRHMTQRQREDAVNEVRVLASVSHSKVIRYYEAFVDSDRLYIVTEFGRYGDLYGKIKRQAARGRPFDEDTIWSIFIQVAQGLQAVHARDIIHRDIKSPNIFMCSSNELKLGDLGVAKVMKAGMAQTQIGTPYYMSPEVWRGRAYHKKSDIWSLGCLLYELAALQRPFEARDERSLAQKIFRGVYTPLDPTRSSDLHDMVRMCLAQDPNKRPATDEILRMPFIVRRLQDDLFAKPDENLHRGKALISTIRVPRDLKLLANKLPEPKYSPFRSKSCAPPVQSRYDISTAEAFESPRAARGGGDKENIRGLLPMLMENPREMPGNNGYKSSPGRMIQQRQEKIIAAANRRSIELMAGSPQRQGQQHKNLPPPAPPAVRRSSDAAPPRPSVIANVEQGRGRRRYNFDR